MALNSLACLLLTRNNIERRGKGGRGEPGQDSISLAVNCPELLPQLNLRMKQLIICHLAYEVGWMDDLYFKQSTNLLGSFRWGLTTDQFQFSQIEQLFIVYCKQRLQGMY